MIDFFNTVLYPIEWGVAWVMVLFHRFFTFLGMSPDSGISWALSIVGLVIVLRIMLIPLFVKQIHASRRMQLIQPEMQKIQAKYKGKTDPDSRQAMTAETMALYKKTGTNPFSSCLPILLQSPFFFALFTVLNNLPAIAEGKMKAIGPLDATLAAQAESSTLFGAPLSSTFLGSTSIEPKILTAVLIILMSLTTFTTQRQLMRKNMPQSALESPFAKQQNIILYALPVLFAVSGVNFPIGVLLYWLTTNLWSMGQQFYVIRRLPAPGSAAEKAYQDRMARKGKVAKTATVKGLDEAPQDEVPQDEAPKSGQRQQPVGKKRAKRKGPASAAGAGPVTPPPPASPESAT